MQDSLPPPPAVVRWPQGAGSDNPPAPFKAPTPLLCPHVCWGAPAAWQPAIPPCGMHAHARPAAAPRVLCIGCLHMRLTKLFVPSLDACAPRQEGGTAWVHTQELPCSTPLREASQASHDTCHATPLQMPRCGHRVITIGPRQPANCMYGAPYRMHAKDGPRKIGPRRTSVSVQAGVRWHCFLRRGRQPGK